MISPMSTARPQHCYDHRLRELVQRTGDVTIATDLGVPRSTARGWLRTAPTVVVSRVVSTDILHFGARVLAVYGQGCSWPASDPDTVLAVCSSDRMIPVSRLSRPRRTCRRLSARKARSALGGHAAVSSDGHVSQAADRLTSARARRAATAPDVRCAGTASPVPKYISSGVCPRNAEWGRTRLCSST